MSVKLNSFKKLNRAVFLDRDGVINCAIVINQKPYAPIKLKKLKILPGVKKGLKELQKSNWLTIVVTNQPDAARGKAKLRDIELINKYLKKKLPISAFYTCYHDTIDYCDCRKPSPGFFFKAKKAYKIDLKKSFMIGDRWSDIEAGRRAGCKTIFIYYGYAEKQPRKYNYKVKSLPEAVKIILNK